MIPEEYQDLPDRFKRLFEWGNPIKPGYSYREWEDYLHHGFTHTDHLTLRELMTDEDLLNGDEGESNTWVPLYAWRILGQLKSVEAIADFVYLVACFPDDETILSEIPVALGMIGKPAMVSITDLLMDELEIEDLKIMAVDALVEMAQQYPELRSEIIEHFRQYLQSPNPDYFGLNGLLTAQLIKIKAVELIDEIRDLYKNNFADLMVTGDIEDVEIEMGLRERRSTPRPKYGFPAALEQLVERMEAQESGKLFHPDSDWRRADRALKTMTTFTRKTPKVGRNEPCPCGSGKKFKRCCMNQ